MHQGDERRTHPRYQAPESLSAVAVFPTKPDLQVRLKDISLGGFCFVTEADISGESYLDISLKTAGGGGSILRVDASARIAWHIRDEATTTHIAGAQFVELSESDRQTLEEILDSLKLK